MDRNHSIDFLRSIGTLLIILAHVSAPKLLTDIRSFDVITLVFISGMSIGYSKKKSYKQYIGSRIKKLLLPAYIAAFLICSIIGLGSIVFDGINISWNYVIRSFLLIDGNSIGFIWIVKVYLFIAMLLPIIQAFENRIVNSNNLYIVIFIFLVLTSVCIKYFNSSIVVNEYLYYAIQYSLVALIGLRFSKDKATRFVPLILSIIVFWVYQIYIGEFSISDYKFPPHIYWISYGIIITIILYVIIEKYVDSMPSATLKIIEWISTNSFPIYINHIYFIWSVFFFERMICELWWPIKYIYVVFGTFILTLLIGKIKQVMKNRIKCSIAN